MNLTRCVLRVGGWREELPGHVDVARALELISASGLDVVALRSYWVERGPQWVMLVDDTGYRDGRPVNDAATALYHAQCRPGTTHPICGDVVILDDRDFATDHAQEFQP